MFNILNYMIMKKKNIFSAVCVAIAIVGGLVFGHTNSSVLAENDLLLENVEALTRDEIEPDVKPKICHRVKASCTCYRPGVYGRMFCSVSVLSVEEYTCTSPLNCEDVGVTECLPGCSC